MSNLKPGAEPAKNLYQTPEIEELNLDVSNAFLDSTISKATGIGGNWTDYGDD